MNKKSISIEGKEIILQINKFAPQANASVLAQVGETIVLATVVSSNPREEIDYFPLYVEYQEKLYAGGKIKGSRWVKREGRPSDEAVLTARLIDRSIRPLFPQDYRNEVQVIITVLSVDGENDPDIPSICATSAALAISDIPWNGPIGTVRIGLKNNNFLINPNYKEIEESELDLVISGTRKELVMIEAGAKETTEEKILAAIDQGTKTIEKMIKLIEALQKEFGVKKQNWERKSISPELIKAVRKKADQPLKDLINEGKNEAVSLEKLTAIKESITEELTDESKKEISILVDEHFKKLIRDQILNKKRRIDGRKPDEIRPLTIEVGLFPRIHGSALFQRGLTQALTITTLGSPSLEQWIENMEGEETKRYIHHYYMPPFSVGETGRLGWPSRREVGHGALAERALEPVLPGKDRFPYTIRVVSEIMSSNGSTSMASVCGSSLSLMDAGAPIKKAVAGIAMGLVISSKIKEQNSKRKIQNSELKINDCVILTDILGLEDHIGDMDFKVAGTEQGITALQMDVKILGITVKILAQGLAQARKARVYILKEMKKVLPAPRASVSKYAPKVAVLQVPKDKIGEIIGSGGKVIRQIISETETNIDIDDEGVVTISGMAKESISKAINWIERLTKEVEVGEEYFGEVKRIQPFGIFVEILPGKEGLVHVSQMSTSYVKNPEEIVKIGQKVKVRVLKVDEAGRIDLTMIFGAGRQKSKSNLKQNKKFPSKSFRYQKRY